MTVALIVSVDTEEEFDWSQAGATPQWSLNHVRALPRFQELCDRYSVRPTYLVDYPIATSPEAVRVLGEFYRRGVCEIGAHLHPWTNPPIEEASTPRNTFLCNLPLALQEAKVAQLTSAIGNAFGVKPMSFKAGRYGIDFQLAPCLQELGYTVDSSVIAFTSYASEEGPDFSRYSWQPFWIGMTKHIAADNQQRSASKRREPLLEVPCTVGFNRRPQSWWAQVHNVLSHPLLRPLHPVGVLDRTRMLRKIVLSPELSRSSDLTTLMRILAQGADSVLNLTLHSPSLEAGHTPFVRTAGDLDRFYQALTTALDFAIHRLGAKPCTLSEYRTQFSRNLAA